MAHQMGVCRCGKKRHWPKNSKVGDTWKCYSCGQTTTLVAEGGKKTRTVRSKKPPKNVSNSSRSGSSNVSSSNSSSCFPKGTNILTPVGSKDISLLNKGDHVVSIDSDNKHHISRVLKVKVHSNERLWLIKFSDGSCLKTTSNHAFFTKNGWVESQNLISGSDIFSSNSKKITQKKVTFSSEIQESDDVYNLYVENNFNFVANGMIAHSFSKFRQVRIFIWSIHAKFMGIKSGYIKKKGGYIYPT